MILNNDTKWYPMMFIESQGVWWEWIHAVILASMSSLTGRLSHRKNNEIKMWHENKDLRVNKNWKMACIIIWRYACWWRNFEIYLLKYNLELYPSPLINTVCMWT